MAFTLRFKNLKMASKPVLVGASVKSLILATVVNTHDDFYWVGGFFESYLLKVWNTVSVATLSNKFKKVATQFAAETSDSEFLVPFQDRKSVV